MNASNGHEGQRHVSATPGAVDVRVYTDATWTPTPAWELASPTAQSQGNDSSCWRIQRFISGSVPTSSSSSPQVCTHAVFHLWLCVSLLRALSIRLQAALSLPSPPLLLYLSLIFIPFLHKITLLPLCLIHIHLGINNSPHSLVLHSSGNSQSHSGTRTSATHLWRSWKQFKIL